jgi:hypothetical protein
MTLSITTFGIMTLNVRIKYATIDIATLGTMTLGAECLYDNIVHDQCHS